MYVCTPAEQLSAPHSVRQTNPNAKGLNATAVESTGEILNMSATPTLTLPEELILMLLNEDNGYFHQVPGWQLNCAVAGAVLAELSLLSRIDTDLDSLFLICNTQTGDPALDPTLEEIADEPKQRNAQYWIERLAHRAESIIELSLDRLVDLHILEHHNGEFWTLAPISAVRHSYQNVDSIADSAGQFIKTRIAKIIFTNAIPDPRDVIIVCLINTCDVFRFMFQLDDDAEERIRIICKMDLIGRSLAEAVMHNATVPLLKRSRLTKRIPVVNLRQLLRNQQLRNGNLPALFAELATRYGPVYQIRPPFSPPLLFLAGPQINHWANRHGRMYLRARDYFADFEKVYGATGVLPALDGADHFRLRKAMAPAYSRKRLQNQVDLVYGHARNFMADWKVGESYAAISLCRRMINGQISPLSIAVDSQDLYDDLMAYKERALIVYMLRVLPKFMLRTPAMKRRAKAIDTLVNRIQSIHTPAQRAGCPRNFADDVLSLNASDPQLLPETNLRFALSAALIASLYLGDALSFTLYTMASKPELYTRIRNEADTLFNNGDPDGGAFTSSAVDTTYRFVTECLRMYPIVPVSVRNVMNTCLVEGYELPMGARIHIAQTAPHYMEDVFPDPHTFDIDRYLPPRNEHRSPGYAPYGVGTHRCLGYRWMELQLMINLLMVAHHFTIEIAPSNFKFRINPLPSLKPSKKLRFRVVEQVHEIRA